MAAPQGEHISALARRAALLETRLAREKFNLVAAAGPKAAGIGFLNGHEIEAGQHFRDAREIAVLVLRGPEMPPGAAHHVTVIAGMEPDLDVVGQQSIGRVRRFGHARIVSAVP